MESKEFDIQIIEGWKQYLGLMFQKEPKPAAFIFPEKTNTAIHTYFCKAMLVIWLLDGSVVDIKAVGPNKRNIRPNSKFDTIIEIPIKYLLQKTKGL